MADTVIVDEGPAVTISYIRQVITYTIATASGTAVVEAEDEPTVYEIRDGGSQGVRGMSAYQVAVADGFVGSESAWLASLDGADGDPGDSAYTIAVANGFIGDEAAWLASLQGAPGDDADVTEANIIAALGYTPADAANISSAFADLSGDPTDNAALVTWGAGLAGTTDHGALTGLADDDHPQYYNAARGAAAFDALGAADAKVIDSIADADTTHAPSRNAVFDALATKADLVGGVIPTAQIPAIAITDYLGPVASQAAMLALVGQQGDWALRSDLGTTFVITGADPTQLSNWTQLNYPTAPVTSVNGQTGAVTLAAADVGAATTAQGALADTAVQPVALDGYLPLTLTGNTTVNVGVQQLTFTSGFLIGDFDTGAGSVSDHLVTDWGPIDRAVMIGAIDDSSPCQINACVAGADMIAANLMVRARGTYAVPTTLVNGDQISGTYHLGYDGTNFIFAAEERVEIVGAVSTGVVPADRVWYMGGSVGGFVEAMRLHDNGDLAAVGTITASNFSGTSSSSNTGDVSLAAVGSAPSANAATLSAQVLTLQPADATHPGVVTTTTQSFAGVKTFTSSPIVPDPSAATDAVNLQTLQTYATNANLTGPVTSTGNATAIANGAISNAMLANAAVATLSGTNSGDQDLSSYATLSKVAARVAYGA